MTWGATIWAQGPSVHSSSYLLCAFVLAVRSLSLASIEDPPKLDAKLRSGAAESLSFDHIGPGKGLADQSRKKSADWAPV